MPRPIKSLAYLQRFRRGESQAFREFVKAKKALIQRHSGLSNVPERLIIKELFHQFKTAPQPVDHAFNIAEAAKAVAKRQGKPRKMFRRQRK